MIDSESALAENRAWICPKCGNSALGNECTECGHRRENASSPVQLAKGRDLGAIHASKTGGLLLVMTWIYAALILITLASIRWLGSTWWPVVVILFMPRALFLLPLGLLSLLSGFRRAFNHWLLQGTVALVVLGPLMGLSFPVGRLFWGSIDGERVRVATVNLGLTGVRVADLEGWVLDNRVDVICFQEVNTDNRELEAYLAKGWFVNKKRSIASRWPIVAELPSLEERSDTDGRDSATMDRVRIETPEGVDFIVTSVHLPTVRPGFYRLLKGEPAGLERHVDWWRTEMKRILDKVDESRDVRSILAGDFNMPADESAMAALRSAFRFGFEEAGWGYGYTRPTGFPWVRIDHVLAGPGWEFTHCEVGRNLGSDHLPILAELVVTP